MKQKLTEERVCRALTAIPADCAYDTWYKVARAIYAALGEDGFDLFDFWSSQSPEKYPGRRRCRYQWEMSKRLTDIGPGTLLYYERLGCDGHVA